MKQRPQDGIRIASVVFVKVLLGQINGRVGNIPRLDNIGAVRWRFRDIPAPAKPNAAVFLQGIANRNRQAPLGAASIRVGRRYAVRHDHQAAQNASSQGFDRRTADCISPTME